ncbi:MAG: class I SAM-dependent methyltransferase [Bradyrhizobium sp.]|nr:class I SAM-dependent methyltransferase [Bradyrhizobium sp.]
MIAAIKAEVSSITGRILLLGTTAGLLQTGRNLTAIDRSAELAQNARQSAHVAAVAGDWAAMPFSKASFSACIGDGSFISLDYPHRLTRVLDEIARCLTPGGTLACRVFLRPDVPETVGELLTAAKAHRLSFQHFKFKFAMAVAPDLGSHTTIPIAALPGRFDAEFPDRGSLAARTGWDRAEIDTIDIYRASRSKYSFPTRTQFLDALPAKLILRKIRPVEGHPFGQEWPIVVLDRKIDD